MNFLLHRHLAERDLGSPVAGVGAMLPDLWRMADRRVRPRSGVGAAGEVLAGVDHHLEADRWFHRHRVFRDGRRATADRFRAARLRAPKMLLLAHAAWELCLDGALVRRRGLDDTLAALRAGLADAGPAALRDAADRHHFDHHRRSPVARADFDRRLRHLLAELADGGWIAGYRHGAGLAARLGGVRRRLRLPPMDAADNRRLAGACDELLAVAEERLGELLAAPRSAPE